MTRDELKQLIQGPIATLPTPMDDDYRINFGIMSDLTEWWIEQGLVTGKAVLKVAAAMGEGPDLADDEWPHLLRTVVQAANGRGAVVCGLKMKDTTKTIEDAKRAQALGAIGLQIDLPVFHHPTQDDMVRFFSDISDAIDIGILIYNTWWFNHPTLGAQSISPESMLRLKDAEHVVGVKWAVPPDGPIAYDDMRQFADIFNVIDNTNQPVRCHQNGGRGYIASAIHAYPSHPLRVWELCEAKRYDEAQAEQDRVLGPISQFAAKLNKRSGGYRLQKAMMEAIGKPVGPPRPPTLPLSPEELAELREIMISLDWPLVKQAAAATA
jgi:4-hydroxy-tetrahydrodipicolinate synthase